VEKANSSKLIADYETERERYIAFTKSLRQLFRDLLASSKVEVLPIEGRTKTRKSFAEKIKREDKVGKYSELSEITDLSGIRIIAYLQEDCKRICDIIRSNFLVDDENSIDKTKPEEVDRFGYASTHLIVSLDEKRALLPEFSDFKGLKAEVQVRTVLQHAWAVLDWQFRYKSSQEAPAEVRRKLFRISAFLEGADENFSEVHGCIEQLRIEYDARVKSGDLDISLNAESLSVFIRESDKAGQIYDAFIAAGFSPLEMTPESTARFLRTLRALGINSLKQLEDRLDALAIDPKHVAQQILKSFTEKFAVSEFTMSRIGALRLSILADLSDEEYERVALEAFQRQGSVDLFREVRATL
jgi:putative GTP pyrophosphokinase